MRGDDTQRLSSLRRNPVVRFHWLEEGPRTRNGKNAWLAGMSWRRKVERALREFDLNFTRWFVLETLRELAVELGDAVNQNQIAARTKLDRSTVCVVMQWLDERGYVSRDIDMTGASWRLYLDESGMELLRLVAPVVESMSSGELAAEVIEHVDAGD